jgi:hypothetical protein
MQPVVPPSYVPFGANTFRHELDEVRHDLEQGLDDVQKQIQKGIEDYLKSDEYKAQYRKDMRAELQEVKEALGTHKSLLCTMQDTEAYLESRHALFCLYAVSILVTSLVTSLVMLGQHHIPICSCHSQSAVGGCCVQVSNM